MLYKITASVTQDQKLLVKYPCLEDFGYTDIAVIRERRIKILDENGKAMYQMIPKTFYVPGIEINTLEELQKLQAAIGEPLIFTEDEIEIYDGFRE